MKRDVSDRDRARIDEIVREVARIVRSITGDESFETRLFGSWVSGRARRHSDIDIAIEGPRPVDPIQMAEIRDACDKLPTLYTIDLVDLKRASAGFRESVRSQTRRGRP